MPRGEGSFAMNFSQRMFREKFSNFRKLGKAAESQCFQRSDEGRRKIREENFSLDGVKGEKFSRRGQKTRLEPYFPWLRLIRFERRTSAFANSSAVVIPMAFNSRR